jgi:hypothetical protein
MSTKWSKWRVQRVVVPGFRAGSWTVLGDDDVPVEPIEGWFTTVPLCQLVVM